MSRSNVHKGTHWNLSWRARLHFGPRNAPVLFPLWLIRERRSGLDPARQTSVAAESRHLRAGAGGLRRGGGSGFRSVTPATRRPRLSLGRGFQNAQPKTGHPRVLCEHAARQSREHGSWFWIWAVPLARRSCQEQSRFLYHKAHEAFGGTDPTSDAHI